ncbi:zymogen granule protein 16 homolog B [Nannospalax galili]|uniref:zymogen granule protein 16 homolog B n=1 Tax=Nannospalax galili TaxID=1026970 RepID=UPI0004ED66CC|nr:zymogen granule protein 16 homolog B [Nannospalax galili]
MCRPEAMLLLLILALLGTPTFGATSYYGLTSGTHFCTSVPKGKDLEGIRMRIRGPRILSVQLKHGDTWGEVYGVTGGRIEEFILNKGEYITWLYGSYLINIQHLIVYTDWIRNHIFGTSTRNEFSAFPNQYGQVLKGFCGFYNLGGISSFGFIWDDAEGNSTSTKACS